MKTYVGSVISNLSNDSSSVAPTVMLNTCTVHHIQGTLHFIHTRYMYVVGMLLLVNGIVGCRNDMFCWWYCRCRRAETEKIILSLVFVSGMYEQKRSFCLVYCSAEKIILACVM